MDWQIENGENGRLFGWSEMVVVCGEKKMTKVKVTEEDYAVLELSSDVLAADAGERAEVFGLSGGKLLLYLDV